MRDVGLLQSTLAMPAATFGGVFLHPTIPEMAAAYLFHIVANHPFIDGNKRAGLISAMVFLGLNGLTLHAGPDALTDLVLGVAAEGTGKAQIAVFFERHLRSARRQRPR